MKNSTIIPRNKFALVRKEYELNGQVAAIELAVKYAIPLENCRACEADSPSNKHCCLICGQETKLISHTPEPWKIEEPNFEELTICTNEIIIGTILRQGDLEKEGEMNAKLICESPIMVKVIKELIKQFGGISARTPQQKEAINQAKAVYFNATGLHLNL